jgi:pyruvate/2-oxoglutarate dehydrogenase complex dihydrolipoamide dehydrogenase (E3) component
LPVTPPIAGLDRLGPDDGVHLLHSMADTFALIRTLEHKQVQRAVIVGAGYVGLEMAEALVARGLAVTQLEQLPEVLPTVDPELGGLVRAELERHGVNVSCETRVDAIATTPEASAGRLEVSASGPDGQPTR